MVNLQLGVNFVDMKFSENVKFAKISTHNLIVTLRYAQASDPTTSLCSGMRCRMVAILDNILSGCDGDPGPGLAIVLCRNNPTRALCPGTSCRDRLR